MVARQRFFFQRQYEAYDDRGACILLKVVETTSMRWDASHFKPLFLEDFLGF
jgi:hypothetical protein